MRQDSFLRKLMFLEALQSQPLSSQLAPQIVDGAVLVILSLQGWQLRATSKLKDEVLAFRVHLFGVTGENGQNSEVKGHTVEIAKLDERVQRIEDTTPERRGRRKTDRTRKAQA